MRDRIMSVTGKSDMVALVKPIREITRPEDADQRTRYEIELLELFRGSAGRTGGHTLVLAGAGSETPELTPDSCYLVFLVSGVGGQSLPQEGETEWHLVTLSEPVPVPPESRAAYVSNMKAYLAVEADELHPGEMKKHILRMLDTGIEFFQFDAALEAQYVQDWSSSELDQLIVAVRGTDARPPLTGITRETVTIVIVCKADIEKIRDLARRMLSDGYTDDVYWGLYMRKDSSADSAVLELLADSDLTVRTEAIRLAGLLRRSAMLDSVEEQIGILPDDEAKARLLNAVEEARALVDRD